MSHHSGNTETPSTEDRIVTTRRKYLNLLLLIPFIALLWVPFYNSIEPTFLGFPFFYWYQFLWVPLTSLIIFIVYRGE